MPMGGYTPMPMDEITFRHGCFLVNLLHIFRTTFLINPFRGLLLHLNIVANNLAQESVR